jgi:hypothetical protein
MRKFNTVHLHPVAFLFLARAFQNHAGQHASKRSQHAQMWNTAMKCAPGSLMLILTFGFHFLTRGCFGVPSTRRAFAKRRLKSPNANNNQSINQSINQQEALSHHSIITTRRCSKLSPCHPLISVTTNAMNPCCDPHFSASAVVDPPPRDATVSVMAPH